MNEQEKNRGKLIVLISSMLLLVFYCVIVAYVLFNIVHIYISENFVCGMIFECIGFSVLLGVVLLNILRKTVKTGYYVSMVISTVAYSLILNLINVFGIFVIPNMFFFLVHMILLFLYLLIEIPMLIMGKQ